MNSLLKIKDSYNMYIINQHGVDLETLKFKFTVDTSYGDGLNQLQLPFVLGQTYNCYVNKGDGSPEIHITTWDQAETLLTWSTGTIYQVSIRGEMGGWSYNDIGDKLKISSLVQWGNVGVDYLAGGFYGCINMLSIPNTPITGADNCVTVDNIFRNCSGLTGSIPAGLFDNCPLIATDGFRNAFNGCLGLTGSIPANLFRYNTLVGSNGFFAVFSGCSGLTGSIPAGLFDNCPLVSLNGFYQSFNGCSGLTGSIPVDLFRYNTLVAGLAFQSTFSNCSGLTGSIPVDLFRYNTLAVGFIQTFINCSGLTGSIPVDLFRYNINVTSFFRVLRGCTGLTGSIPEDLFYYNVNCTNYSSALNSCRNLTLPVRLFNLGQLSIVTTFDDFMYSDSTLYSFTGTIQDIWNYALTALHLNAFTNQIALTNYVAIPNDWKGL